MDAKTIIEIVKSGGTLENANMLELQLEGVTKGVIKLFLEGKITKEEAYPRIATGLYRMKAS